MLFVFIRIFGIMNLCKGSNYCQFCHVVLSNYRGGWNDSIDAELQRCVVGVLSYTTSKLHETKQMYNMIK